LADQADSKAATVVAAAATVVAVAATVEAAVATVAEAAPQETEADMDVTIAVDLDDHDPGNVSGIHYLSRLTLLLGHHHDEAADRHPNMTITEDRSSIASSFLCLACLNCTFLLPSIFPLPIQISLSCSFHHRVLKTYYHVYSRYCSRVYPSDILPQMKTSLKHESVFITRKTFHNSL